MDDLWKNHIAGQWIGGNVAIDVINPATGAVLARQAMADARDVDAAVAAARAAHETGTLPAMTSQALFGALSIMETSRNP